MLYLETIIDFCMSQNDVSQEFPFDKKTIVFKVHGKIFALCNIEQWEQGQGSLNLKNDPAKNSELRDNYSSIISGYHMNKKHWNTVNVWEEELDNDFVFELIQESYNLVLKKVSFKNKEKARL